jgi:ferric-dicitrate binding protein FerR (iron transport regulator)
VTPGRNFWFYWQRIAAILIIPLLIASLFLIQQEPDLLDKKESEIVYNEVHTAFGTRSKLKLSDSTIVWLNSGSSLKYPVVFNGGIRKVFLIGEAYFEVEGDETRPFIVETNSIRVMATGTKFNVQEYENSITSEVMLLSGKVNVHESAQVDDGRIITEMNQNQYLSYNIATKERFINNEDVSRYVAWKDGKLIFRNDPLGKVICRLSMMYNVDIELQEELKKQPYHATFLLEESLEEFLKLLEMSAPLSFKEVKREPFADGSFPKKKVIIYSIN